MTELHHWSDEAIPDVRQETHLRFQVGGKLAEYLLRPLNPQARASHGPVLYADLHYPIPIDGVNDPMMVSEAAKIWQKSGDRQLPVKNLIMQVRKADVNVRHLVPGDHIDIGLGVSPENHQKILRTLSALGAQDLSKARPDDLRLIPFIHFDYEDLDGNVEESMEVSREKVRDLLQHRDRYNKGLGQQSTSYFVSPPTPRR